jgi:hypothetical protein
MAVTFTVESMGPQAKISGVPLKVGTHKYNLDSKDPLTAFQLKALLDAGIIKDLDVVLPDELIKETEKALNEGTLETITEKKFERKGSLKHVPSEVIYKGSKIPKSVKVKPKKETKDDGPTRPATKATKKSRKNNN